MNFWQHLRQLIAYLAPESSLISPRKHIAIITALLAVAAVAGAVVLTPSHRTRPDVWEILHERLSSRAQVDLFDDFSHGLDDWQSIENRTSNWSYDNNGFVNPGVLSFFKPSMGLTDYEMDALVQIEARGLGLVFRAASPRNYQVAKLVVDGYGPMRSLAVERYTITPGRASRPVFTRYPLHFQLDTMYRLHLELKQDAFALYINGSLIDYWSDRELPAGGVGLFCLPGEHARIAWVRVSHNADSVGRMCSFLSSLL